MIGKLDQRITLQRQIETPDGGGGVVRMWGNVANNACPWANVKAKAGREGLDEGRTNATFIVVFTIYNRTDLSEKDRIVWNGENYNIRGILRTGDRKLFLQVEAERGVAN